MMLIGMGFWEEEVMLETQAKIAKKRGRFDSWCKRAGLELDTTKESINMTEGVLDFLLKSELNARLFFFRVKGMWFKVHSKHIFY